MSATAFKRDLADFKTILDFAQIVQSPERLRLLLVLTVVDIRAVGPGVWNSWKRQLLRSEEHTSELQSLMRISYAVFCLKKKKKIHKQNKINTNNNTTHP